MRIPLMDHLLDALIVEADHAPDALLEEARRVLRTSGVLVIPVGNSLSIPGTAPSREADRLRAAGFLTHFVLPGATRGVTRQGALLLAISLGTVG